MSDQKKKSILLDLSEEESQKKSKPPIFLFIGIAFLVIGALIITLILNNSNDQSTASSEANAIKPLAQEPVPPKKKAQVEVVDANKQVPQTEEATIELPVTEAPEATKKTSVITKVPVIEKPIVAEEKPEPAPQPREQLSKVLKLSKKYATLLGDTTTTTTLTDALFFQLENARKTNASNSEKHALENEYTSVLIEQTTQQIKSALDEASKNLEKSKLTAFAALEWKRFSEAYATASSKKPDSFDQLQSYDQSYSDFQAFTSAASKNLKALAERAKNTQQITQATSYYKKLLLLSAENGSAISYLNQHAHSAGEQAHKAPANIRMRFVPAGDYTLGSPNNEFQRETDEAMREITLTRAFFIAETEVTQGQWLEIMGSLPKQFPDDSELRGNELPVHNITWAEAQTFCDKLSKQSGDYTYRLPTEAEWEVACRAGTRLPYNNNSDLLNLSQANIFDSNADNNIDAPTTVGSYTPNQWGLFDMHGNVWEWTSDWMTSTNQLGKVDPSNTTLSESSDENLSTKVLRGGSYYDEAGSARSANRWSYSPSVATTYIGFRIVTTFEL